MHLSCRIVQSKRDANKCSVTGRNKTIAGPCDYQQVQHQNCADYRCNRTINKILHARSISKELKKGTPVLLQMTSNTRRNIPEPAFQLMSISNTFDVCLEHNRDPITVFAGNIRPSHCKFSSPSQEIFDFLRTAKALVEV